MRRIFVALAAVALSFGVAAGAETNRSPRVAPLDENIRSLPTCSWDQVAKVENALDALIARTHGDAAGARSIGIATRGRIEAGCDPGRRAGNLQEVGHDRLGKMRSCAGAIPGEQEKFSHSHAARRWSRSPTRRRPLPCARRPAATSGKTKVGIISSLAVRQDARAVDTLIALLDDRDRDVAGAALLALAEDRQPESGGTRSRPFRRRPPRRWKTWPRTPACGRRSGCSRRANPRRPQPFIND